MATKAQRDEALQTLRERFKIQPGETVYTILKHVSRSGMMRVLDLYVIRDGQPLRITWSAADATGYRYNRKHEGLELGGCGMDMGFEAVYQLSYALFPDGFDCIGEGCPSNAHYNRELAPPGTCRDHVEQKKGACRDLDCKAWHHTESGYALRQRWM